MPLKNYTSTSKNTFEAIQKCLSQHKAQQVMFEFDDKGKVKTLSFGLKINARVYGFKLPARIEKVEQIFLAHKNAKKRYEWEPDQTLTQEEKEQAYRTAWANIRDWMTAQMALIDTDMVKAEEVFLPYMINNRGQTYFEALAQNDFLLPSGDKE
jgi:hypothetical protein